MDIPLDPSTSCLFKDLLEYTQLPPVLALQRCNYAAAELAVRWHKRKSVPEFYDDELYLFDLTKYQLVLEHTKAIKRMIEQIKQLGLKKILEFGGGIGEFSRLCAGEGGQPAYYDLDGEIKKYALWRFEKHQSPVVVRSAYPLKEFWEVVNVMDVLEHLEDPSTVIADLAENAKYIFCNPEDIKYNLLYPQHISKFDLSPYFERLEGYLWRNKNKT